MLLLRPARRLSVHRLRQTSKITVVLACALSLLASTALCGCLGLAEKTYVAATVDGVAIDEEDVTSYIEGFRSEDSDRETDTGWAQYLSSNGYTSESFRTYVLETVFIPDLVVKIKAEKKGISVTDDDLDSLIAAEKEHYEELYGADSWNGVLASYGYDEQTWRESETTRLLRSKLKDLVINEQQPTDQDIMDKAADVAANYNGKHSYYILFDDESQAQETLERMGGKSASMTLSAFKKAARSAAKLYGLGAQVTDGHGAIVSYTGLKYAGWSSLGVTGTNSAYNNALNDLELNTVSDVVKLAEGSWAIIYCDDSYVFQENDLQDTSKIPSPIYSRIKEAVAELLREEKFDDWLAKRQAKMNVKVNSMPSGLPYDVSHL